MEAISLHHRLSAEGCMKKARQALPQSACGSQPPQEGAFNDPYQK